MGTIDETLRTLLGTPFQAWCRKTAGIPLSKPVTEFPRWLRMPPTIYFSPRLVWRFNTIRDAEALVFEARRVDEAQHPKEDEKDKGAEPDKTAEPTKEAKDLTKEVKDLTKELKDLAKEFKDQAKEIKGMKEKHANEVRTARESRNAQKKLTLHLMDQIEDRKKEDKSSSNKS